MAPGAATAPVATTTATAPAVGTGAGTGVGTESTGFIKALKDVPGKITERFSNSEKLADMTLKAAGLLAGSYIMQPEIPQGEQDMLNAQVEELKKLRDSNEALFKQRLEQAQSLIGESKYFDPEYFGLQRARRAQLTAGRAKRAGLRGLTGAAREAEARRFDLAAGRDVGTAYDVGYGQGISGRLQTMQAGLAAMPPEYSGNALKAGSDLTTQYALATGRAREQATRERQAAGSLFGMI
jgi:hypothetical protein